MSKLPPASDRKVAFWPPGPTSRKSTSSGQVCESPTSDTSTSVIVPERPEIEQVDGYGYPLPRPESPPRARRGRAAVAAVAVAAARSSEERPFAPRRRRS